ncbi:hypothetical protein JNUCC42_03540 [Brevibacterium sp. JNUCC-42]|nr:hypothetical protein JNUCC42_03540 [Brevibacterium sp. JNUCC-42]
MESNKDRQEALKYTRFVVVDTTSWLPARVETQLRPIADSLVLSLLGLKQIAL